MATPNFLTNLANPQVQSPYLYVQAAGADGSDGITQGVHLRWDLMRSLEDHLPKGRLTESGTYQSTAGFNKADDFVKLYRAPYDKQYLTSVDFSTAPSSVMEAPSASRRWTYQVTVQEESSAGATPTTTVNTVFVRFLDLAKYDSVRASFNPMTDPAGFMQSYSGVVEMEVQNKLAFAAVVSGNMINSTSGIPAIARVEAISLPENYPGEDLFISCRHRFTIYPYYKGFEIDKSSIVNDTLMLMPEPAPMNKLFSENIKYIRFDYTNVRPSIVSLETYTDFIEGRETTEWTEIGETDGFSLSIDDSTVFNRLDNTTYAINGNWPKYNDTNPAGEFTVRTDNYKDRWVPQLALNLPDQAADNRLKQAVLTYLDLSKSANNALAEFNLDSESPNDDSTYRISYLDMLKIVSMDYHIARMLGLGHIDAGNHTEPYIYMVKYVSTAKLEPVMPSNFTMNHLYMTLPTTIYDQRPVVTPVLESLTYGLEVPNGTNQPIQLTDANGYSLYEQSRYIGLNKKPFELLRKFLPSDPFFNGEEFCFGESTRAVFYGVEYREDNASYIAPELLKDPMYVDISGTKETMPLFDRANPFYHHRETQEGIHHYAVYGVNWFSRASSLSNELATNDTQFARINTLMPPVNFAAQLIQEESPLLFTTGREQAMLTALAASNPPGNDSTLLRVTFDWNEAHNMAYQYADKVQFFYRERVPRNVRGKIKSVTDLAGNRAEVRTVSFVEASSSSSPAPVISPAVPPGDESVFINSVFTCEGEQYMVENVLQSTVPGEGVIFIIKKSRTVITQESNGVTLPVETYASPASDTQFMVVENMAEPSNWTDQHTFEVNLQTFSNHTEVVTFADGATKTMNIGGVYLPATITELDSVTETGATVIGNSGIYKMQFATNPLTESQADVEFYKGTVRIMSANGAEMRTLPVVSITRDTNGAIVSPLEIFVFDSQRTMAGTALIPTGANINVNFHPGYRAYLKAIQGTNFIDNVILPVAPAQDKETFIAARSVDSTEGLESALTSPAVVYARRIMVPMQPGPLTGPVFATRPDFYGRSTYTFDTTVNLNGREPYALVFFRANAKKILSTLYNATPGTNGKSTVDEILEDLAGVDQSGIGSIWQTLLEVTLDANGDFASVGGYQFPTPDNNDYIIPLAKPHSSPANAAKPFDGVRKPGATYTIPASSPVSTLQMTQIIKDAINNAFLPLTEQPVLYSKIQSGPSTSNKQPVIRDSNGKLLPTDHASYDPAPMASKFGSTVRFTDYLLDGAARDVYFYYAIEMSNDLKLSERSGVAGPVRLVNSFPAEPPVIRKVITQLANPIQNIETGVKLQLNKYDVKENIKKFRILRSTDAASITSARTMAEAKVVDITAQYNNDYYEIIDDFADLDFPPYGEPLYYRVSALREITNEHLNGQGEYDLEDAPSKPSNVVMANIVDVFNPAAPKLRSRNGSTSSTQLHDVTISWKKVGYNITYRLMKMTSSGNWEKIYETRTNNAAIEFTLPQPLDKYDAEGNSIYHRFKVDTENASGLLNLEENVLTIVTGCNDLYTQLDGILNYFDGTQEPALLTDQLVPTNVALYPAWLAFTDITSPMPAGHTFDRIEVQLSDGLNHTATKTISATGYSVSFSHGDGNGLVLDGSVANVTYTVTATLFTNLCTAGATWKHTLKYGPCNDLVDITSLIGFADSNSASISPLVTSNIDNGVAYPGTMTFSDATTLPFGHTLDRIEVTLKDSMGGTFTRNVTTAVPAVFSHGDGNLVLDNTGPNQLYTVTAKLFTNLCQNSIEREYTLNYTYTPCNAVAALTSIVSMQDSTHTISPLVSGDVDNGVAYPGTLTFTRIAAMPSGHTFDKMDILLEDDLGGASLKTMSGTATTLAFANGDGGLVLGAINPNRTYYVTVVLYTDLCTTGTSFFYTAKYTHV